MSKRADTANAPASEAGEMWALTLRATGRRPKTVTTYTEGLRGLETFCGKPGDVVSRLDVKRWLDHMLATLAPASASVRLRSVKRFFAFCVEEGLRDDNPTAGLTVKVQRKAFKMPTPAEVEAMLAHCTRTRSGVRDAAIIALLAATGARRGEVAGLKREDIDLIGYSVTFHNSKSVRRTVPITPQAAMRVKRWLMMSLKRPAASAQGRSCRNVWEVNNPEDLVRRAVPRHCGGRWSAHSLRRAFAVGWLMKQGSQPGLMAMCGWEDPTMVWEYAKGAAEMLAAEEYRRLVG